MTKSALVGLVKGLARDPGPRGITINTMQPDPVDTEMNPAEGNFATLMKSFMAGPRPRGDIWNFRLPEPALKATGRSRSAPGR